MKVYNILVFPCGSEIGLELYRSLNNLKEINLWGASSVDDHGKYCFKNYIGCVPSINDANCIPKLAEIVAENKIDAIYPAMDLVITILKQNEEELGCKIISSELATTDMCLSKEKTYDYFKERIRVPEVYHQNNIQFPAFAKPKIGYGSRGAKKIISQEILKVHLSEYPNCIVTEYLPGTEFTVDCFTNYKGELLFVMPRERSRIMNGISVNTKSYSLDKLTFENIAQTLNNSIKFSGAWFFQVKRNAKNELVLLEIASRFGGSSSLWKAIGVNLPLLSILNSFDVELKIISNNYYVEMDRSLNNSFFIDIKYNHIYFDFDDCILLNEKLNLDAIKLIYQALNNKIKTYLLTRHKNTNLFEVLKKYKIDSLFDEIIHLTNGEKKSDYILYKDAIFIDDSFSERKDVNDSIGIPTFGPESITCFINEE